MNEVVPVALSVVFIVSAGGCADRTEGETGDEGDASIDGSSSAYLPLVLDSLATWGKANGFGGQGSGIDEFTAPTGIALAPDESELYVLDTVNARIKAMSLDGAVLRSWAHPYASCPSFGSGLAVAGDGTIYVADDTIHGIVGYSPEGARRYEWPFVGAGPFCNSDYDGHAHDVIVASDGSVVASCRKSVTTAGSAETASRGAPEVVDAASPKTRWPVPVEPTAQGVGKFDWNT